MTRIGEKGGERGRGRGGGGGKEEASRSDNVGKLCGCTEGRGSNSVLSS